MVILFLVVFGTFACASYPDDPRNPQTGDDTYTVKEDGFLTIPVEDGILVNDLPKEGTQSFLLTVGELQTDNGGQVVMEEDGSFTYEPADNFYGTDQLIYTIKNEKNKSSDGLLAITVTPENDAPQPVNDNQVISVGQVANIDVLANDVEPDGDEMTIAEVGEVGFGSVTIENNQLFYTPQANHSGDVSFSYTVADSANTQAKAWVFLTLTDANNGIDVQPDTISVAEDSSTTLPLSQLLLNDTGDGLTVIALGEAQNGTVVHDDENFTYTPNVDFSGSDTFTYTVQAANGNTASTTVTVTVTGTTDAPTISTIVDQATRAGTMTD
ncbi:MAG: Ig-like domain-containing protein, partial [Desulfobacteraceae bacterium]